MAIKEKEINRNNLREYNIYAGINGGFGGMHYKYTSLFESLEEAELEAYYAACGEYTGYEGNNGLPTFLEAIEEARSELDGGWDLDDDDSELLDVANEIYNDYVEGWISYKAVLTDEDTETDKEDLIRDYIIEDDNNSCEVSSEA